MTPRLLASSASFAMATISSGFGGRPASESFSFHNHHELHCVLLFRHLRGLLALQFFPQLPMLLDRRAGSKVFQFEELANLDLTFLALTLRIGRPLGPFDSFF